MTALADLSAAGVAVWLDDLSRERLRSGNLAELVRDKEVVGVTTNPSIFQKALSDGAAYDEQVRDLALRGTDVGEAVRMLTTYDVRWACDVMREVYDRTDGVDGRVSIEVDPRVAHDPDRTVAEAKALWWLVDRPNLYIKIPATKAGLPGHHPGARSGISVNVTLIFSLERYDAVMDAFLDGMEQAKENGTTCPGWARSRPSSSPGWTARSTSSSATAPRCAGRPPSPTPGWPTSTTSRSSGRPLEGPRVGRRQAAAPAVGLHRCQGPVLRRHAVRRRAGRAGHRQHHAGGTLEAVADHGKVRGDTVTSTYADAQQVLDDLRRAASTTTRWSTSSSPRAWRSSRRPGTTSSPP
jgi:transaldolase